MPTAVRDKRTSPKTLKADDDAAPTDRVRVVVADPHPLTALAIRNQLEDSDRLSVAAVISDPSMLARTLSKQDCDVLVVDPLLFGRGNANMPDWLRRNYPQLPILAFASHLPSDAVQVWSKVHRCHVLNKRATITQLRRTVERVAGYGARDIDAFAATSAPVVRLTPRQAQIAALICHGLAVTAIARQLGLSVKTVSAHKMLASNRLGVVGTVGLVRALTSTPTTPTRVFRSR